MSKLIPLETRLTPEHADLKELWEQLAKLSAHIVADNALYNGDYPIDIRERQIAGQKTIVDAIIATHAKVTQPVDTITEPDFTPLGCQVSILTARSIVQNSYNSLTPVKTDEELKELLNARHVLRQGVKENQIAKGSTKVVVEGSQFCKPGLVEKVGSFYNLWSWLCGGFYTDGKIADTRPIVISPALPQPFASVNYLVVDGEDVGDSIQHQLWKELGQRPQPAGPIPMELWKEHCRKVLQLPEGTVEAVVHFPGEALAVDEPAIISVICNFQTGRVVFRNVPHATES